MKVPGQSVRGSSTGRPVMVLLDALGKRWALRVLWELSKSSPLKFRQLQHNADDISPSSLNSRLSELKHLHLIEVTDDGYRLTSHGLSLVTLFSPLDRWAEEWSRCFTNPPEVIDTPSNK